MALGGVAVDVEAVAVEVEAVAVNVEGCSSASAAKPL